MSKLQFPWNCANLGNLTTTNRFSRIANVRQMNEMLLLFKCNTSTNGSTRRLVIYDIFLNGTGEKEITSLSARTNCKVAFSFTYK